MSIMLCGLLRFCWRLGVCGVWMYARWRTVFGWGVAGEEYADVLILRKEAKVLFCLGYVRLFWERIAPCQL